MNLKPLLAGLFVWMLALTVAAVDPPKCDVCGAQILTTGFTIEDRVTGEQKNLCMDCAKIQERCFICGLPVKEGCKKLADGRFICARDAKDVIESDAQAKDICSDVRDDLNRLFSRFMTFPGDNVNVSIVDRFHLENLFKAPGSESTCVSVYGATASNPVQGGKYIHTIDLLSDLLKPRLMAISAHELTHAWMGENVTLQRRRALDHDTVEGFCELIAYKYMESRNEEIEMRNIRRNAYTKGQIDILVAADARYGFNTLLEWIKSGEDTKLELAHLDRVRAVQSGINGPAPDLTWEPPLQSPPPREPDKLTLRGISGTASHRYALINDATFEPRERGKVRVGVTNVSVICLEIRKNSVVLQVNGQKQELFLNVK